MGGWAIAVHGGAGVDPNLPPQRQEQAKQLLTRCLNLGISSLRSNASALDVVELVVRNSSLSPSLLHVLFFPFITFKTNLYPFVLWRSLAILRPILHLNLYKTPKDFKFTEMVFRRVPAWLVLHACTLYLKARNIEPMEWKAITIKSRNVVAIAATIIVCSV